MEMMKKIKRVLEVFTREGMYTFFYLVRDKLRAKQSPQKKYRKWRSMHEGGRKAEPGKEPEPFFTLIVCGRGQQECLEVSGLCYAAVEALHAGEQLLEELLEKAKGSYIGFVPESVRLSENALQQVADRLNEEYYSDCQFVYGDEDVVKNGVRTEPFFKPDYSPDTLRSFYYSGCFFVKKELLKKLSYSRRTPVRFDGYLIALECTFHIKAEQVCHIPRIVSHRLVKEEKGCDLEELALKKKELFARYGQSIRSEQVTCTQAVRVLYVPQKKPLVSIVIPSKDNPQMLQVCLDSIAAYTDYASYEIIVVDNGSSEENRTSYQRLCDSFIKPCIYLYEKKEFNFSYMCNIGEKRASGDYVLFLNDDIEILADTARDWLERMVGHAMQSHTGAVGAKLLYPDTNQIQHIGVVNYESGAAHIFSKTLDEGSLDHGRNVLDYNYSVVTGACLLVSREKFREVGGFSQELAVTFNDVELCFKLLKAGYYNVVRTDVTLYHHESITRGEDALDKKKFLRHMKEREKLFAMHPEYVKTDAFYSKNLTQKYLDASINTDDAVMESRLFTDEERTSKSWQETDKMQCQIEYAEVTDCVCIRGFAYLTGVRYNNLNRVCVILSGEQKNFYLVAEKLYNPTIALQLESDKNLNFVEFVAKYPAKKLPAGCYQVGVALQPFGSSTVFTQLSKRTVLVRDAEKTSDKRNEN